MNILILLSTYQYNEILKELSNLDGLVDNSQLNDI
jgi:hypothetical protein